MLKETTYHLTDEDYEKLTIYGKALMYSFSLLSNDGVIKLQRMAAAVAEKAKEKNETMQILEVIGEAFIQ